MDVIAAVLKDLYRFAIVYHFGLRNANVVSYTSDEKQTDSIDESIESKFLLEPTPSYDLLPETPSAPVVPNTADIRYESVGYAFTPETLLYVLPTRTFDGVITRLPYGDSFQILNTQGKWCNVMYGDVQGWVHLDDVTESNTKLKPKFVPGERYDASNPSTIKLRTIIDDAFHAVPLDAILQDVEFVSYKLSEKRRTIDWPLIRPRVAGTWQRVLRGVQGVHMGISPKTGSIMEYLLEDNVGHVAYVDSVYPDEGITISEIGYPEEGFFTERTLGRTEWKELRPIFIEVG